LSIELASQSSQVSVCVMVYIHIQFSLLYIT
jgi:hypothetical protein